jgi:hypothetical protein
LVEQRIEKNPPALKLQHKWQLQREVKTVCFTLCDIPQLSLNPPKKLFKILQWHWHVYSICVAGNGSGSGMKCRF